MTSRSFLIVAVTLALLLSAADAQSPDAPPSPATAAPVQAAPQSNPAPAPASPPPQAAPVPNPKVVVPQPPVLRPTLLLAYWPPEPDKQRAAFVDTVAIYDRGRLIDPWARTSDIPGEVNRWLPHFDRRFFPKGRRFPIYVAGQRTAFATVLTPASITCDSLSARVSVEPPPGPSKRAVAGGPPAESHSDWQKPLTDAQQQSLLAIAQDALAPSGVAANQVALVSATSTRISERGPSVLIGDFSAGSYRAFLIVEAERSGSYRTVIANIRDVGDDEKEEYREQFLGQLDLSGDGLDEIVTIAFHYETWDYNIYRRTPKGTWEQIFNGGGGGC